MNTPLKTAIQHLARPLGLSVAQDRDELVEYVNKYREMLYNNYENRKLFDDYRMCFAVQRYSLECCDTGCLCDSGYYGITLPADMAGIVAAYQYREPLSLPSRWKEVFYGTNYTGASVALVPVAGQFATERDVQKLTKLKVYAASPEDTGKKVFVTAIDGSGAKHNLEFSLAGDSWVSVDLPVVAVTSVVIDSAVTGAVTLAEEDGYELSVYAPSESVPQYSRFKFTGYRPCDTILVQSTREFRDVYFDEDVVEYGTRLVLDSAGRYFRYGEKGTDSKELQRAEYDLQKMYASIDGIRARKRAGSTEDSSIIRRRINYRKELR